MLPRQTLSWHVRTAVQGAVVCLACLACLATSFCLYSTLHTAGGHSKCLHVQPNTIKVVAIFMIDAHHSSRAFLPRPPDGLLGLRFLFLSLSALLTDEGYL